MIKEVLFVNIGYENGLYTFKNNDICSEIPEGIMVNTPFYNQENSLEELVDTISMEPEEDVVFTYSYDNQKLVKRLAHILADEYGKVVYLVNAKLGNALCYTGGDYTIYVLENYEDLEKVDEIDFEVLTRIPELSKEEETEADHGYYMAMRNGYDAFITGIYPENLSNTLAKHVQLETDTVIEDVSLHLDMNGAFLINADEDIHIDIQDLNCFNHLHTVKDREVQFDDTTTSFKNIVCSYSQFTHWKERGAIYPDYEYYLKIENEQDLDRFAEDLDLFQSSARVDTISKRLADECRWTNQCSLKRLTRYRVANEVVKPCITSEKTLLDMQAEPTRKLLEANKLCDRTMIQRKCVDCSMKAVCSKCACLPENISQEKFCEFMHKYPFVGEYLLKKRVVNFLGRFSKIFEGDSHLEVTSSAHSFEYTATEGGKAGSRNVYIFRKGQDYYTLHMQKGNLMKIEAKYVFLLEAWALEEEMETVIKKAAQKYNLDISMAERIVREGYQQLKKGGMIS